MFIHWDNSNRIHEGNNYINTRRMHTVLCTPFASKDTNGMIGNLFIFKKQTTKENRLKSPPFKKYLFSIEGKCEAVIQCSIKPLLWSTVERFFFVKMKLGTDFNISFITVPIEALVHPLCVIHDCSGDNNIYVVVLPKRNWSQFFGERIIITTNI